MAMPTREELQRRTELYHETGGYTLTATEGEAIDPASGYVPATIKAQAILLLDQQREDERRAARPVQTKRKRRVT